MDAANATFTSVLAHAKLGNVNIPPQIDYVIDAVANASIWTILLTLLLLAVAYDQCAYTPRTSNPLCTVP